ncbi:unnamed protein product [Natator depressus]|uniref:uncharacterized protein LOC141992986 n=1 Tax=Natator depressus TaxID=27790 RepID=UPI003D58CB07
MEGPGRALLRLAAACCLLAGLLLPLPGDGQETLTDQAVSPAQPSTEPGSFPLCEADGFSPEATAPPVTSTDKDGAATPHPNFSSPRAVELDESIPSDPNATTTKGTRLQTSAPAVSADATTGLRNKNLPVLPTPALAASTTNQPGQNGTEPSSPTGPTGAATVAPTPPPPKDALATTGSSPLEPSAFSTLGPTTGNPEPTAESPEPTPQTAQENATAESTAGPTTAPAAMTTGSPPATTTPSTTTVTPRASSTTRAATPAVMQPSADPVHEKASVLDVGDDDDQDLPSSAVAGAMGADPLVIGVISLFVVTVGILALVGFLRYRQRYSRMEFRRLQDLPMDDMMEDTPLSLYSY